VRHHHAVKTGGEKGQNRLGQRLQVSHQRLIVPDSPNLLRRIGEVADPDPGEGVLDLHRGLDRAAGRTRARNCDQHANVFFGMYRSSGAVKVRSKVHGHAGIGQDASQLTPPVRLITRQQKARTVALLEGKADNLARNRNVLLLEAVASTTTKAARRLPD
jgi:hypothetical protein